MLTKITGSIFIFALIAILPLSLVYSANKDRADNYCQKKGYDKALRQTLVLIDEIAVEAQVGKEIPPINKELIRIILSFANTETARENNTFLPRERLKILVLPKDGTGPQSIFTGCQPFYSDEEADKITSGKSSWKSNTDKYLGKGAIAEAEKYADVFKKNLARTLVSIGKSVTLDSRNEKDVEFTQHSLVSSLKSASRLVNLHDGIPRIILLSDFSAFGKLKLRDETDARTQGLEMAKKANIDFSRAELYAVQVGEASQNKLSREFAHSFFLGSEALLSGWSNKAIGRLDSNPHTVKYFQGIIQYGNDVAPPLRLRLAWDKNGMLVNSWVSVSLKNNVSTPLSGAALCDESGKCTITSDDSGFAQVWSTDPDEEAEYDISLPFSGLRYFDIKIEGTKATGRIWDPAVDNVGGQKDLPFELNLVKDGVF